MKRNLTVFLLLGLAACSSGKPDPTKATVLTYPIENTGDYTVRCDLASIGGASHGSFFAVVPPGNYTVSANCGYKKGFLGYEKRALLNISLATQANQRYMLQIKVPNDNEIQGWFVNDQNQPVTQAFSAQGQDPVMVPEITPVKR